MRCWGITDGSAGMVAQVRALAFALGIEVEMKRIALRPYYRIIPNAVYAAGHKYAILERALDKKRSDAIAPPWPDLVISCGRKGALIAMGISKAAAQTKCINIQDPRVPSYHFDVVVAMRHDAISGGNVLKTRFALHRITPVLLAGARERYGAYFSAYAKPHIAVLLGGSTNKYTLTAKAMKKVISQLEQLLAAHSGSLLITPSRRTGEKNIAMLRQAFAGNDRVYCYDFSEENPYLGLLALADTIVVTNDSVNMMSEAHATGKPLYILPLPGHRGTKPSQFADGLLRDGIARPLGATLESWSYPASDEMARVAQEIKNRLLS
jgi:mitochondrial fission protein ELM1